MRLTREVTEELVKEVAGEDTIKLVGLLKDKDNISEFKLAEKLRLTVNNVRNMLYRLQEHNLVTSTRKKDKKKGWYIYYWTFNVPQARSLIRVVKQRKLDQLKSRLRTETEETFYICPEKCTRFKMENAMDYDFKCPECGVVLQEENNQEIIEKLKTMVVEVEEDLAKPIVETRTRARRTKDKKSRRGRPRLKKRGRPRLAKRGRPKLKRRGRPRLVRAMRGRPRLAKRGRPRLKKTGRPKLKKRGRPKLVIKRGRPRLAKISRPKLVRRGRPRLVRVRKRLGFIRPRVRKVRKPRKRKTPKKRSKPKKRSVLRKVRRFLRRKKK